MLLEKIDQLTVHQTFCLICVLSSRTFSPFLLAQLLALVVSVPLIGATDALQKWAAILITLAAVVGIYLAFTPTVTRYLLRDEAAPESQ